MIWLRSRQTLVTSSWCWCWCCLHLPDRLQCVLDKLPAVCNRAACECIMQMPHIRAAGADLLPLSALCRLPPGYNPNLRFMSHLWEPLRHMYRWV